MTSPYADVKRDGMNSLLKFAKLLCAIVQSFGAVIRSKYADNPAIIALVTAIDAVCALLPEAQAEFAEFPSDDGLPPSDPSEALGIDENAPPAPDPEII